MALGDNDGVIFLVAHKFPLSTEFSQQEYWNGMPFLPPGYLPNSGIRSNSSPLHLQHWEVDSLPLAPPGKPKGKTEKKERFHVWSMKSWFGILGGSSLPLMSAISLHVCVCVCVCVFHSFFIYSSFGGQLSCFCILTLVNNSAINIGVHLCFWINAFFFFGQIPSCVLPILYSKSIFNFSEIFLVFFYIGDTS